MKSLTIERGRRERERERERKVLHLAIVVRVAEADFKKAIEDQGLTLDVGEQDNFGSEDGAPWFQRF